MSDKILLSNKIKVLSKYRGTSKFSMWKKLKPNDIIHIQIELASPGSNRGMNYATEVSFRVNENYYIFTCSLTQASKYLDNVDYEIKKD